MDELQNILPSDRYNKLLSESLMSVKLMFNMTTINKSLLSLQRQRCSLLFATKGLGVWN